MIVDGRRLEAFATVLAGIRSHAGMCTHVQGQAIGHAKGLPANLPADTDIIVFFLLPFNAQSAMMERKLPNIYELWIYDFVFYVHY